MHQQAGVGREVDEIRVDAGTAADAQPTPSAKLLIFSSQSLTSAGIVDESTTRLKSAPRTARDLRAVKACFDASGTKYDLRQQVGAGAGQLFCHDPNGAKVERDFDASKTLWTHHTRRGAFVRPHTSGNPLIASLARNRLPSYYLPTGRSNMFFECAQV